MPPVGPVKTRSSLPLAASQTFTLLSRPAERKSGSLGWMSTAVTVFSWAGIDLSSSKIVGSFAPAVLARAIPSFAFESFGLRASAPWNAAIASR